MTEYENVKEAVMALVEYNTAKEIKRWPSGEPSTLEDLQDLNMEAIYQLCDLLGVDPETD